MYIIIYDLVGNLGVTWCVDNVTQVVQVEDLKRRSDVRHVCRVFWWMVSGIYLSGISLF